jgi:hypothetical protein
VQQTHKWRGSHTGTSMGSIACLSTLLLVATSCDSRSPAEPTPTNLVRLEVTGPDRIGQSQPTPFFATAFLADGTSRDVTKEATWSAGTEVRNMGGGLFSNERFGETYITAQIFDPPASGRKHVFVLPEGLYRLSGSVVENDGAAGPVSGAVVEIVDQDPFRSLQASTTGDGRYRIYGVRAGTSEIRIQKSGYLPETRSIDVQSHHVLDVSLTLAKPRPIIGGEWVLRIQADPACTQPVWYGSSAALTSPLQTALHSRSYSAFVRQDGSRAQVQVSGPAVSIPQSSLQDTFPGVLEPGRLAIELGSYSLFAYGESRPGIVEQLTASSYLVVDGRIELSTETWTGALNGTLQLVPWNPWLNQVAPLETCYSTSHRVDLQRE